VSYILVAIGGAIGAALRHGVNRAALALWGPNYPFGTLAVNVLGSFLMGLVVAAFVARSGAVENWRLFLTTGVLGGFTTFSAFSLDAALIWERGDHVTLTIYVAASVLFSIGGLLLGMAAVRVAG